MRIINKKTKLPYEVSPEDWAKLQANGESRKYKVDKSKPQEVKAPKLIIEPTYESILKDANKLFKAKKYKESKELYLKVPAIKDGIKAIKHFSSKGIRTNCTLIFSSGQALLAAKAGATYVSPFVGRLDDISTNGMQLIDDIRLIFDNYAFETQILAASVRHTIHIIQCAEIGADVMTGPLSAIVGLLKHPLTDEC